VYTVSGAGISCDGNGVGMSSRRNPLAIRQLIQAASFKLDITLGFDRINLERNNYD
jgi:hypothetical protein